MLYIFIVFILITLYKVNLKNIKTINAEALSTENTTMINGFFVGLILFSHFNSYVVTNLTIDSIYYYIFSKIGQLMVTSFLFYSGYGIYESIKHKENYIDNFFKNRILKLFVSFAFALCLYMILNLIIGKTYTIKHILLSFIGITSIGNSNWYMFATFCMYFFILFSFKKDDINALLLSLILTVCYILFVMKFIGYAWWCNTILCFNAGMFFSYFKDKILFFLDNISHYLLSLVILILIFLLACINNFGYFTYELISLSFIMIVVMLSLKIKVGNKYLLWLGKNTFNCYVLQRLVYIFYDYVGLSKYNIYLYFALSISTIFILVCIFNKILSKIYKLLKFSNGKKEVR